MNTIQSDRVKLGIGGEVLNGLTSISYSSNIPYLKGSLINSGIPKTALTGESLFSLSLSKFTTPNDIKKFLKLFILGLSKDSVTVISDSFGSKATGMKMEDCWFDQFTFGVGSSQLSTCSWECKSKVLKNFVNEEVEVFEPSSSEFMNNMFFEFSSSVDSFENVEDISLSVSTNKTLISSLWGDDSLWMGLIEASLSFSTPYVERAEVLESTNFDSVDFYLSIYSDEQKTEKIVEFDLSGSRLDSYSDGFSESSQGSASYSFSKPISHKEIKF